MHTELDHLVVGARSLEEGAAWCEATFGIVPGAGGQHPLMGTHNRLLRLEGATFPRAYLEIIAIDPQGAPLGRARWFGLDTPEVQAALADGPQLLHWVARSSALEAQHQRLAQAGHEAGRVLAAERATPAGLLRWRIVVPDDGLPRCAGALPTLIEWGGVHPTDTLPASGLQLQALEVRGLPDAAAEVLQPACIQRPGNAGPVLRASLLGPRGPASLSSPFRV